MFFYSGRDIDSMEIGKLIYRDSLRKKIFLLLLRVFLIFCNKNWTALPTYSRNIY